MIDAALVAVAAAGQNFRDAVDRLVAQLGEKHHPALHGTPEAQKFNRELFLAHARYYGTLNRHNHDPDPTNHSDWTSILLANTYDAVREADPHHVRHRLVTVAALCQAWADDIDRTTAAPEET